MAEKKGGRNHPLPGKQLEIVVERVGRVAAPVVPVQFQRRPTVADRARGPTRKVVAGGKGTRPRSKPANTQFHSAGKRYAVAEPRFSTVRSSSTSFLARYLNSSANTWPAHRVYVALHSEACLAGRRALANYGGNIQKNFNPLLFRCSPSTLCGGGDLQFEEQALYQESACYVGLSRGRSPV